MIMDKLPSGNWRARVHLGGGKYKTITGASKKDVQLKAAEFEAGLLSVSENAYDSMTLGEAMKKYIDSKNSILSPSTIKGYVSISEHCVLNLQKIKLKDITPERIQIAINDETAQGRGAKTCKNVHCFISAVLKMYKPDLHLNTRLPQRVKNEISIPQEEEIKKLVEYFKGTNMEVPFMLGAFCGMRASEITGLVWKNIDLKNNRIRICQAYVRGNDGYVMKGAKSVAGERSIKLFPFVKTALMEHHNDDPDARVSEVQNETLHKRLTKALVALNLPHYRFHDLRHYCVSAMLSQNVPKNYIVDFVGHADGTMIDRVYGHIMQNKKDSVEDVMEEYFEKSVMKSVMKK